MSKFLFTETKFYHLAKVNTSGKTITVEKMGSKEYATWQEAKQDVKGDYNAVIRHRVKDVLIYQPDEKASQNAKDKASDTKKSTSKASPKKTTGKKASTGKKSSSKKTNKKSDKELLKAIKK